MYVMIRWLIKELSRVSLTPILTEDELNNNSTPLNFDYSHYTLYFTHYAYILKMKVKQDCSEGKFVCYVSPSDPNPILGIHTEDEGQNQLYTVVL